MTVAKAQTKVDTDRITKTAYISRVARRAGLPVRVVAEVYKHAIDELLDIAVNGETLLLTGFGSFYTQSHKGHPVQFSKGTGKIPDYLVLKFSASPGLNRSLSDIRGVSGSDEDEEVHSDEAVTAS